LVLQAPAFASVLYESLLDRSGNIITPLLAIAAHEKSGTRVTYLQGVPGAGKTFTMAIIAVLIGLVLKRRVLWTATGNAPLNIAIQLLAERFSDAPAEIRQKIA
jgi:hypothetical protein